MEYEEITENFKKLKKLEKIFYDNVIGVKTKISKYVITNYSNGECRFILLDTKLRANSSYFETQIEILKKYFSDGDLIYKFKSIKEAGKWLLQDDE